MQKRRLAPQRVDEALRLARVMRAFRKSDVTDRMPGYAEAIIFYLAAQPQATATMGDLRRFFGWTSTRASRLTGSLMRSGLLEVIPDQSDRRLVSLRLTDLGVSLVDASLADRSAD